MKQILDLKANKTEVGLKSDLILHFKSFKGLKKFKSFN